MMKKIKITLVLLLALIFAGCSDKGNDVDDLMVRLTILEQMRSGINNDIATLQGLVSAMQSHDYITDITSYEDGSYAITFARFGKVEVKQGTYPVIGPNGNWWLGSTDTGVKAQGENGSDGKTPLITISEYSGTYYWKINDEWLRDGNGAVMPVAGTAPQMRISEDGYWEISTDGGVSWSSTGVKAIGDDGDSIFAPDGIVIGSSKVTFTLADSTVFSIPRQFDIFIGSEDASTPVEVTSAGTTIPIILPADFAEDDYRSFIATITYSTGETTAIAAKDEASTGSTGALWSVSITLPTFTSGKCNNDACLTVKSPSEAASGTTAMLTVAIITQDGNKFATSHPLVTQ